MRRSLCLICTAVVLLGLSQGTLTAHIWEVSSPDHRQTYSFGSERHRQWFERHGHLAIAMEFTNDPYVDRVEPRQYDDFNFDFPSITLVPASHAFVYHPHGRRVIAVAREHPGLLGPEVELLPSSVLVVQKVHGLLTLTLLIQSP